MPDPSAIGASQFPQTRVGRAIAVASQRTGIDFDYLVDQARLESNFDPQARAKTSSASGLYQFTKQTWLGTVKQHGAEHGMEWAANAIERNSDGSYYISDPGLTGSILDMRQQPEAASLMAAEFASDNATFLQNSLGHSVQQVDLYLAHFLGAAGAAKFLAAYDANPESAAAPDFPKAAAANQPIFYDGAGHPRSYAAIRALFQKKLDSDGGFSGGSGAPAFAGSQANWSVRANTPNPGPAMTMRGFEPMPKGLSIAFAQQAYQRLESMNGRNEA